MADTRQVEVLITTQHTIVNKTQEQKQKTQKPTTQNKQVEKQNGLADIFLKKEFLRRTADFVVDEGLYWLERSYRLNDDYISQRNLTVAKNIINQSISSGTRVIAATVAFGAVGLAVSLVGEAINIGTRIIHNYTEQNDRIRQLNAQLDFSRVRAGYSLTAGSIGEL